MSYLVSLGSFIIGIISLVLYFYQFKKARNFSKLNYAKKSHNIIHNFSSPINKLVLKFGEKPIETLTITFLAIWNNADNPIYSSDLLKTVPISIRTIDNSEILDVQTVFFSNKSNSFNITNISKNFFKITFKYLKKKEGILLKIFHTGADSESIVANCSIKDGENPSLVEFSDKLTVKNNKEKKVQFTRNFSFFLSILETLILFSLTESTRLGISAFTQIFFIFIFICFLHRVNLSTLVFFASKLDPVGWEPLKNFDILHEIYQKNE